VNVLGFSGLHTSVSFKRRELPHLPPRAYRIVQGLDAAAALVDSEGIKAAAAEERFTREKGTGAFPVRAISSCLASARLAPGDIGHVAHSFSYESTRTLYENSGSNFRRRQFHEVYSPEVQLQFLREHFPGIPWETRLVHVPHHLAHAASAFYLSGLEESLILVADGSGEMESTTVAVGRGNDITILKRIPALHSLGLLYGLGTLYLGFDFGLDEYKVMGLAPYGDSRRLFDTFMDLVHLQDDGGYTIPVLLQNQSLEERETYAGTLRILSEKLGPPREPEESITQRHMDVAAGLQATLHAVLLHVLRHFRHETGQRNLCMAGGVALNCTANGVIRRSRMFKSMFVQPAAGDDGSALGAALYVQRQRNPAVRYPRMGLPLWGPAYDDPGLELALNRLGCAHTVFGRFEDLAREVARRIAGGEIVGWFQGAMEFGPRALGSRSILADPRDPGMRDRINALVKKREAFRPFAPAVAAEAAAEYFDIVEGDETTYSCMLLVAQLRDRYLGQFPAVTHVNGSARVQTVAREDHPRFWTLLQCLGEITGSPLVLNTSFNVRGQPIVCTPDEAVETFLAAHLDALAIGNRLAVHPCP
jgi:carbamoyltransferase